MNTSVKFSDSENDYFYDLWQRIMKTANVLFYSATCDIYAIWRYIRSAIRQHVKISITCYTVTLSIYVCSKKAITQFLNHEQKLCWALVRTGRLMTFITGRSARSAAMPVLFLLNGPKMVFRPIGATRCPDKREIWYGGAEPRSTPPCQISPLLGRKCGNTAPKTVKISNFGQKFVPQGRLICNIFTKFSVFVQVYR